MPPKKKDKGGEETLTRVAIVNADRYTGAYIIAWLHGTAYHQVQAQKVPPRVQKELPRRQDWYVATSCTAKCTLHHRQAVR